MVGHDDDGVRLGKQLRRQLHAGSLVAIFAHDRNERIVEAHDRAVFLEQTNHVERGTLAHVVDVALVRDAEHENLAAVHRLLDRR